jgi:hypothetical protein
MLHPFLSEADKSGGSGLLKAVTLLLKGRSGREFIYLTIKSSSRIFLLIRLAIRPLQPGLG